MQILRYKFLPCGTFVVGECLNSPALKNSWPRTCTQFAGTSSWFPHFNLFKFIQIIQIFISIWDYVPYYTFFKYSVCIPHREVFVLGNLSRLLFQKLQGVTFESKIFCITGGLMSFRDFNQRSQLTTCENCFHKQSKSSLFNYSILDFLCSNVFYVFY